MIFSEKSGGSERYSPIAATLAVVLAALTSGNFFSIDIGEVKRIPSESIYLSPENAIASLAFKLISTFLVTYIVTGKQRCVADGKQVNIPAPITSAMWGRILIGYPAVGSAGLDRSRLKQSGCWLLLSQHPDCFSLPTSFPT